jgi:hypothetical protein
MRHWQQGDLALFILLLCGAIFFAEMQVRQEAGASYVSLALLWVIVVGLGIWLLFPA